MGSPSKLPSFLELKKKKKFNETKQTKQKRKNRSIDIALLPRNQK